MHWHNMLRLVEQIFLICSASWVLQMGYLQLFQNSSRVAFFTFVTFKRVESIIILLSNQSLVFICFRFYVVSRCSPGFNLTSAYV